MHDVDSINKALEIVELGGQRFQVPGGYIQPTGYALKHPKLGFLGFKDKPGTPYIPVGGRTALKAVLDAGGFINFNDCVWIQEI